MTGRTVPDAGTKVIVGYPLMTHFAVPMFETTKPSAIVPAAPELVPRATDSDAARQRADAGALVVVLEVEVEVVVVAVETTGT
jgi:hypothetical protein